MKRKSRLVLIAWLAGLALAIVIVSRARYSADMSAFLPRTASAEQQLLVDQLRDGPASRLLLIGIEGSDAIHRAALSHSLAQSLRGSATFAFVSNGELLSADRDRDFIFQHRYVLSDRVNAQQFSVHGLRDALQDSIDGLASPAGLLGKEMLASDPTGETLHFVEGLEREPQPRRVDGVWVSPDGERALLIAQTRASGSDTDAQAAAIGELHSTFSRLQSASGASAAIPPGTAVALGAAATPGPTATLGPGAAAAALIISGPGVFAVTARATIEKEALRLSVISSLAIVALLLLVYRSVRTLTLGLVPVVSGALTGIAAVAVGFGFVHGLTLGFGITLIGEAVDYSIYLFVQAQDERRWTDAAFARWRERYWPTVRLGMWTSVCGFASLLPSGFTGLAQLGLYSTAGLVCAAWVTRFVLPQLLPDQLAIRDLAPLGRFCAGRLTIARRLRYVPIVVLIAGVWIVLVHRDSLWNRELIALSPIPSAEIARDAKLRAQLGASDARAIVLVRAGTLHGALAQAERTAAVLEGLVDQHVIAGFDTPSRFLPSAATQAARRASIPPEPVLRDRLRTALAGLPLRPEALVPFLRDVEAERSAADIGIADLRGTSMAAAVDSLIMQNPTAVTVLMPLHPVDMRPEGVPIDVARVRAALAHAPDPSALVLDLKSESDALYSAYLSEALRLSAAALAVIGVLLVLALRSVVRLLRIVVPLSAAVAAVAAIMAAIGHPMTILHLIGMLLIVAIGSNYALFFEQERAHTSDRHSHLMLASLLIANASTVIGFGVLAFSSVPVLAALGMTVAPGAFLALVFSALWTGSPEHR